MFPMIDGVLIDIVPIHINSLTGSVSQDQVRSLCSSLLCSEPVLYRTTKVAAELNLKCIVRFISSLNKLKILLFLMENWEMGRIGG